MTAVPPFEPDSTQTIPILVDVVTTGLSATETGASGTVKITAPFPAVEKAEIPYMFEAATLAKTDEPHAFENGELLIVAAGI
jgi:hypothetical protein